MKKLVEAVLENLSTKDVFRFRVTCGGCGTEYGNKPVRFSKARFPSATQSEQIIHNALYEQGITMNDTNPDYVVVGETRSYSYERIEKACSLIFNGAKLIGTNPDMTGPTEQGIVPATGSLIAPIEMTTGTKAYFVGKPNPFMMRRAVKRLNATSRDTVIIGDRMDTDIIAGIEAEVDTVLVLSGVTTPENMTRFAYRPGIILEDLAELTGILSKAD